MAATYRGSVSIEWDDSVVLIFSFTDRGTTYYAGFTHLTFAAQNAVGTQKQINQITQVLSQNAIQVSGDPQSWVETVKNAGRGNTIKVVYEDSISTPYTTTTAQSYDLQLLHSISG